MNKIIVFSIVLVSLSSCTGSITEPAVNPTQIEISRQTLVAELEKAPSANQQPQTTIQPSVGSIAGGLGYPSEFLPGMLVIAYRVGTSEYYSISTMDSQVTYQMDNLPPGAYHVVAYYQSHIAGYSQIR